MNLQASVFTGDEWLLEDQVVSGTIVDLSKPLRVSTKLPAVARSKDSVPRLTLSVWVFFCMKASSACTMKAASFSQPLRIDDDRKEEEVTVALTHAF